MKNNSKVMVLRVSEPQKKKQMADEEDKKKTQNESVQRTQKGFQILSERGESKQGSPRPPNLSPVGGEISSVLLS